VRAVRDLPRFALRDLFPAVRLMRTAAVAAPGLEEFFARTP